MVHVKRAVQRGTGTWQIIVKVFRYYFGSWIRATLISFPNIEVQNTKL